MVSTALEARGLVKIYSSLFGRQPQRALAGLDLEVPAGKAFGLIGPNGAGKTTFIKLLLGIARPTGGQVRVLGGDPEDIAVRARIGYLPERLELPGAATPLSFLTSVARMKRLIPQPATLRSLIGRVGLDSAIDRKIKGFSKGMR